MIQKCVYSCASIEKGGREKKKKSLVIDVTKLKIRVIKHDILRPV